MELVEFMSNKECVVETFKVNGLIAKDNTVTDLRGGAALVMAATTAKGITKVENIDYILRGYERFDKKLEKLGVKIQLKI